MELIIYSVNWLAVLVGAIAAYALGALWYSPKMFGKKWMKSVGLDENDKGPVMTAMIAQGVGTLLLAWVIGVTETTQNIMLALLIALTIAVLIKANGLFANKGMYAIKVDAGYVVVMVIVMILAQAIF